jgi:hypothetical protein
VAFSHPLLAAVTVHVATIVFETYAHQQANDNENHSQNRFVSLHFSLKLHGFCDRNFFKKEEKLLFPRQSGDWALNQPTEMWALVGEGVDVARCSGGYGDNRLEAHCEGNVTTSLSDRCIVHLATAFRRGVTVHRPAVAWFDSRLGRILNEFPSIYSWSSGGAFASQYRHLRFKSRPAHKSTDLTESLRGIPQSFSENTGILLQIRSRPLPVRCSLPSSQSTSYALNYWERH